MQHRIQVVGLGSGDLEQLPLGIYKRLIQARETLFLRTENHPIVPFLKEEGISFRSFDDIYEKGRSFEEIYKRITNILLKEVEEKSVLYAVPGHPMVAEKTIQLLLEQGEVPVEIIGGQSFLDDLFTALQIDPIDGFQLVDATSFKRSHLNYRNHLIFCQVYDPFIASDVKLTLLEDLPIDQSITVVQAAGSACERIDKIPLKELDRYKDIDQLTTVYVPPIHKKYLTHTFFRLKEVIETLRGPQGCAWDRAQTHESLRKYAIEEVYELIDAIDAKDDENIIEELGDVLLQVLLHSQIGEDHGYFSIDDVIRSTTEKMINRHPHVFGDVEVHSLKDIERNWEVIKNKEKPSTDQFFLKDIPKSLSRLEIAFIVQKKAAEIGFDWKDPEEVWNKLTEEIREVQEAISAKNKEEMEEEFGDVLFTLVNLMRHYEVQPELALHRSNRKFMRRFQQMERLIRQKGKNIEKMSLEALDRFWEEAKKGEDKDET